MFFINVALDDKEEPPRDSALSAELIRREGRVKNELGISVNCSLTRKNLSAIRHPLSRTHSALILAGKKLDGRGKHEEWGRS